jgi:hypothetical protein
MGLTGVAVVLEAAAAAAAAPERSPRLCAPATSASSTRRASRALQGTAWPCRDQGCHISLAAALK